MWYPRPQFNNVIDIIGFANTSMNGIFGILIVLASWIILFSWFKRYETRTAFAGATTVTFLISIPLTIMKYNGVPIVNPFVTVTLGVLMAIGGMLLWKSEA